MPVAHSNAFSNVKPAPAELFQLAMIFRQSTPDTSTLSRADRRQSDGANPFLRPPGSPRHDRDDVIRLQHRRKISSILIRNTVVPIAVRTTSGSCLAIEGVKSPKTRSYYE